MDQSSSPQVLRAQLADRLGADGAEKVATVLFEAGVAGHVSELLDELQDRSAKLAGQAMESLPDMLERCGPEPVVSWLDVAVTLAGLSGAITLKYLNESPRLLGILDTAVLVKVLETTLELADSDSELRQLRV